MPKRYLGYRPEDSDPDSDPESDEVETPAPLQPSVKAVPEQTFQTRVPRWRPAESDPESDPEKSDEVETPATAVPEQTVETTLQTSVLKTSKWRRPAKRKQVKRQQVKRQEVKRQQVKRPPSERQLQQLEAEAAEALNTERYLEQQLARIEVDLTNLLKAQKNTSDSLDAARQETKYKQSLANEARKKEVS